MPVPGVVIIVVTVPAVVIMIVITLVIVMVIIVIVIVVVTVSVIATVAVIAQAVSHAGTLPTPLDDAQLPGERAVTRRTRSYPANPISGTVAKSGRIDRWNMSGCRPACRLARPRCF